MAQDPTPGQGRPGAPVQRAADAAAQMDTAGEKITVSAVRTRAGVSMDAARQGVEQWRNDSRPPEIPMPDAVQRAFATAWSAAATDAATRHEADRQAAQQVVEAAQAEAVAAGQLVDTEAERVDAQARRGDTAEEHIGQLEQQLAEQVAKYEKHHEATNEALEAERASARQARETRAGARGGSPSLRNKPRSTGGARTSGRERWPTSRIGRHPWHCGPATPLEPALEGVGPQPCGWGANHHSHLHEALANLVTGAGPWLCGVWESPGLFLIHPVHRG